MKEPEYRLSRSGRLHLADVGDALLFWKQNPRSAYATGYLYDTVTTYAQQLFRKGKK